MSRESCANLASKFDFVVKSGPEKSTLELDEQGLARLYEAMGDPKPIPEIRSIFKRYAMNGVKPKTLVFLQVCCSFFEKDYDEFNRIPEDELRRLALESALKKSKETEEIEAALEARKAKEAEIERLRLEQLEKESQLTGVAARQAFFQRQASLPVTETTEQKIKKEAALRKQLKEAKKKEEEDAAEAVDGMTSEKAQLRLKEAMEKKLSAEDAERQRQEQDEAAARTQRKAVHSARWDVKK